VGRNGGAGVLYAANEVIARFNAAAFEVYGTTCHLCGGPDANTVDHLLPQSTHPELRWDLGNVRPAHLSCNSQRRAAPLTDEWAAPAW
jgi:5-methylcytosine-specific restriction endonuclease McrA